MSSENKNDVHPPLWTQEMAKYCPTFANGTFDLLSGTFHPRVYAASAGLKLDHLFEPHETLFPVSLWEQLQEENKSATSWLERCSTPEVDKILNTQAHLVTPELLPWTWVLLSTALFPLDELSHDRIFGLIGPPGTLSGTGKSTLVGTLHRIMGSTGRHQGLMGDDLWTEVKEDKVPAGTIAYFCYDVVKSSPNCNPSYPFVPPTNYPIFFASRTAWEPLKHCLVGMKFSCFPQEVDRGLYGRLAQPESRVLFLLKLVKAHQWGLQQCKAHHERLCVPVTQTLDLHLLPDLTAIVLGYHSTSRMPFPSEFTTW